MTVRLYKSSDASAPVLTGQAGSLLTVLDAVLVNGYGSTAAAGWTIAYTGTNKRQYAPAAGGTGCQLYVDDTAPGTGGAREARITGFKTGTALGSGTGQFPILTQENRGIGALVVRKSSTADAVVRNWTIIADGNTFYMFIESGDWIRPAMPNAWMFGDFASYYDGDQYNCIIIARTVENTSAFGTGNNSASWGTNTGVYEPFSCLHGAINSILTDTIVGHYVAGNFTGLGASIRVGKHSDHAKSGQTGSTAQMGFLGLGPSGGSSTWLFTNAFPYPNAADQGLYTAPVWITHNGGVRGYLKGLWNPLQHVPLQHAETYSGTGNLAGKNFIAMNLLCVNRYELGNGEYYQPGQVHVEYSDTWS